MTNNTLSHVAFILDGNKRWAKLNKLSGKSGYKKGFDNIKKISDYALQKNIKNLTLFTLSSENFNRSSISIIYDIILENFNELIQDLIEKKKIKIKIFGSRKNLPTKITQIFKKAETTSKDNNALNLNIAFNYGFKEEIKMVLEKYKKNKNNIDINNTKEINNLFFLGPFPDPDILIRTGGYKRLSNFIMYNLTYTELFFSDTLWPDFSIEEFDKIIHKYYNISRKYGL